VILVRKRVLPVNQRTPPTNSGTTIDNGGSELALVKNDLAHVRSFHQNIINKNSLSLTAEKCQGFLSSFIHVFFISPHPSCFGATHYPARGC
jgi:hypothetical protein